MPKKPKNIVQETVHLIIERYGESKITIVITRAFAEKIYGEKLFDVIYPIIKC